MTIFNTNPDPITSIKEYKIDENGKRVLIKDPLTIKEDNFLDNLGLSRDDLDDSGDMLEDLKQIAGFDE
mgnify:FL=1|tara:strand:+ start:418 stop:624 length:207 start_codon:yes stop_codon:yes gene_type:complete